MHDLQSLLAGEAERHSPTQAPPFDQIAGRARRRRRFQRAGAIVAAGVAVTGITLVAATVTGDAGRDRAVQAGPTARAPAGTVVPLPTDHWKPGQASMQALTSGVLIIAEQNGSACAWLGSRDTAVLWPEGYGVRLKTGELVDASGKVIAHAGQTVAAGGGGREATSAGPCNAVGQWTFSVQSEVRAGSAVTALPACALGGFRLRQVSLPGGAAGTLYLTLAIDQTRAAGCAVTRLSVAYLDRDGRPIGIDSASQQFLDERVARLVDKAPVLPDTTLYLRVATPEPGSYGLQGCGARQAGRLVVTVNRTQLWLPTTSTVCSIPAARPLISVVAPPTSQRNRVSITAKPL